jgi:integrase
MATVPKIEIYARHSADCSYKGGRGSGSDSVARCKCRKALRWSMGGKQVRRNADTRSWAEAEEVKQRLEDDFRNGIEGRSVVTTEDKTLAQAGEHFIEALALSGDVADVDTLNSYRREFAEREVKGKKAQGHFIGFMEKRGRFYTAQVTADDLMSYKKSWEAHTVAVWKDVDGKRTKVYESRKTNATTKRMKQQKLKRFFTHCLKHGIIKSVPHMDKIKQGERKQTVPLTMDGTHHDCFSRLLWVAETMFEGDEAKKARGILLTMRFSGLSISDAVCLRRDELKMPNGNPRYRIEKRRKKTGVSVNNVVPTWVAEELLSVPNDKEEFFFWANPKGGKADSAVTNWARSFKACFHAAGLPNGHCHALRDLYAVSLFELGATLKQVSKALGHRTTTVTEMYYSPWVTALQDQLDDVLAGVS